MAEKTHVFVFENSDQLLYSEKELLAFYYCKGL